MGCKESLQLGAESFDSNLFFSLSRTEIFIDDDKCENLITSLWILIQLKLQSSNSSYNCVENKHVNLFHAIENNFTFV